MGFEWRIIDFYCISIFFFVSFFSSAVAQEPAKNSQYASATLVIYNQNVADSRKLAAYYAGKRNIPFENLIGMKCSTEEIITRSEYQKTILEPLRKQFDTNGWWERKEDAQGNLRAVHIKMKFDYDKIATKHKDIIEQVLMSIQSILNKSNRDHQKGEYTAILNEPQVKAEMMQWFNIY